MSSSDEWEQVREGWSYYHLLFQQEGYGKLLSEWHRMHLDWMLDQHWTLLIHQQYKISPYQPVADQYQGCTLALEHTPLSDQMQFHMLMIACSFALHEPRHQYVNGLSLDDDWHWLFEEYLRFLTCCRFRGRSNADLAPIIPPCSFSISLSTFHGALDSANSLRPWMTLGLVRLNGFLLLELPCGFSSTECSWWSKLYCANARFSCRPLESERKAQWLFFFYSTHSLNYTL